MANPSHPSNTIESYCLAHGFDSPGDSPRMQPTAPEGPMEADTVSSPSSFLGLPLELRQRIYQLCIPQGLDFNCDGRELYYQNRIRKWKPPPWRPERNTGRPTSESYFSSEEKECCWCIEQSVGVSDCMDITEQDDSDDWEDCSDSDSSEGDAFLERDDLLYCPECRRYRPEIPPFRRSALPGLLLVCRQISVEVETELYRRNTFMVYANKDGESAIAMFHPTRRRRMRKIALVIRFSRASSRLGFIMNPQIWDSVVDDLPNLWIIAQQPTPPPSPYDQMPSSVMKEWKALLMPTLEYLNRSLPESTRIIIDVDNKEETAELMEEAMPKRYLFRELKSADVIFHRGNFSPSLFGYDSSAASLTSDDIESLDL